MTFLLSIEGQLFLGGNQHVFGCELVDGDGNHLSIPNGWYDLANPGPLAGHIAPGSTGRLRVGIAGTSLILR